MSLHHTLTHLASSLVGNMRALMWGEFFGTSLRTQLSTLQAQFATLQSVRSIADRLNAMDGTIQNLQANLDDQMQQVHLKIEASTASTLPNFGTDRDQNDPEERLIEFLFPWLHDKTVIDVGAHRGRFLAEMLEIGFQRVIAFEPHPDLAKTLALGHESNPAVEVYPFALSESDGGAQLHLVRPGMSGTITADPLLFSALEEHGMPDGLEFFAQVPVQTRSLESLVAEGALPREAGLLKIDTEGHDLNVLRGLPHGCRYDIVMHEFWSNDFVFASPGEAQQKEISQHMRRRGYHFSISLARLPEGGLRFTANMPVRLSNSWGNTLYFRDQSLFENAYTFVRSVIPQAV